MHNEPHKSFVSKITLKIVYNSLINSHLNYGILVWGHQAKKLFQIQKKAIRIITKSHYFAHSSRLFKSEKILKLEDIYSMQCLKIFFKYKHSSLPLNILSLFDDQIVISHRYPTSSNLRRQNQQLMEVESRTVNAGNSLRCLLPRLINQCNNNIIDKVSTHSLNGFKIYVKNFFISEYINEECIAPDCYFCSFSRSST